MNKTLTILIILTLLASIRAAADDIEDFKRAQELYMEGKFGEALDAVDLFISEYPESSLLPNALYLAGRLSSELAVALDNFSRIIVKYPRSSVADNALFMIAQYHYAAGSYDKAIIRFKFIADNYKKSDVGDAVHWWVIRAYNALGDLSLARVWAEKLLLRYPTSKYAKLVGARQPDIKPPEPHHFTIQIGSFLKKETATVLKESLVKRGHDAFVTRNEIAGKVLFRVRVGRFSSREEAAEYAEALKKGEGFNGWVTSTNR